MKTTSKSKQLNKELIWESIQDDYFRHLEAEWKALLSRKPDNSTLISTYGKEEVVEICREKISELTYEFNLLKRSYKKLESQSLPETDRPIHELSREYASEGIQNVKKQIDKFSLLYLIAQDRLPKPKNGLTDDQIQQAREYPIYQLYSGRLRKVGRRLTGLCPFHEERTSSFVIYENNSFHCFGCQAHGGNSIDYLMKIENLSFKEAVGRLI